jgi:hypothetical protein
MSFLIGYIGGILGLSPSQTIAVAENPFVVNAIEKSTANSVNQSAEQQIEQAVKSPEVIEAVTTAVNSLPTTVVPPPTESLVQRMKREVEERQKRSSNLKSRNKTIENERIARLAKETAEREAARIKYMEYVKSLPPEEQAKIRSQEEKEADNLRKSRERVNKERIAALASGRIKGGSKKKQRKNRRTRKTNRS